MSRSTVVSFLPAIAWMAFIFFLSSQPSPGVSEVDWIDIAVKKMGHVVVYAVLAVTLYLPLRTVRSGPIAAVLALVLAVAYGASDEFHQSFTGRTALATDVLIDALGAAAGLALAYALTTRLRQQRS